MRPFTVRVRVGVRARVKFRVKANDLAWRPVSSVPGAGTSENPLREIHAFLCEIASLHLLHDHPIRVRVKG